MKGWSLHFDIDKARKNMVHCGWMQQKKKRKKSQKVSESSQKPKHKHRETDTDEIRKNGLSIVEWNGKSDFFYFCIFCFVILSRPFDIIH